MSNMNELPQDVMAEVEHRPNLEVVGYRFTYQDAFGGKPTVLLTATGGEGNRHITYEPLILQGEALLAIDQVKREVEAWKMTAAQMRRNADFYRGLIVRCGEALGPDAYICDDWSVSDSVLALKVPELVEAMCRPKNRFLRALRILLTGK